MGKQRRIQWETLRDEEAGKSEIFEHQESGEDIQRESDIHDDTTPGNTIEEVLQLHNADHAGMILVPAQLNGENYMNWSRSVRRALGARSKLEFLDGSFPKPAVNSVHYKAWMKVDYMISSWIINSISKEYVDAFGHIDTSKKLWDAINQRFNRSNGPKIAKLQRDINGYVQGNQSVLVYFTKLSTMWSELDMALPPLRCTCRARNLAAEREENQRLMQFLNGLNDGYEQARNQILFLEPLPGIDRAYSMILQVEDQKRVTESFGEIAGISAMNVGQNGVAPSSMNVGQNYINRNMPVGGKQYQFRARRSREERMQLYCPHCQKHGHEEKECFKLHGYPDWFKRKDYKGKPRANFAEVDFPSEKSDYGPDIGKLIQTEVMKCMNNMMNTSASTSKSHVDVNMIQSSSKEPEEFQGYYAFSVLDGCGKDTWIIDSGASAHICCNPNLLQSITSLPISQRIFLPDGSTQQVKQSGDAYINDEITLHNVLLAPSFTHNLISVAQMSKENCARVLFLSTHCVIQKSGSDHVLGMGKGAGNLYVIEGRKEDRVQVLSCTAQQMHSQLGHPSLTTMEHMDSVKNLLNPTAINEIQHCEVCLKSKQVRLPFPILNRRSKSPFDLIHVDVWGPYMAENIENVRYMLTIVEDHSRMTWIFLLDNKGQVYSTFKSYVQMVKTQFKRVIKSVRTDNGSEFLNVSMLRLFADLGMLHQRSCVYSPQQNGIVERKHRSILQLARALMFDSRLPQRFWPHSLLTAVWLLNRLPSRVLNWESPYSVMFHTKPDLTFLRPFGCLAYATNIHPRSSKFDSRSIKSIFLGYAPHSKGYLLYDLDNLNTFISRDVKFFPHSYPSLPSSPESSLSQPPFHIFIDATMNTYPTVQPSSSEAPTPSSPMEPPVPATSPSSDIPTLRRSTRATHPPSWLNDFVGSISSSMCSLSSPSSQLTPFTFPYHISPIFSPTYTSFLVNVTSFTEPHSYSEASKYVEWTTAMTAELQALEDNQTWILTDLPEGKKAIGSKWVYKVKLRADGTVERFKARLVAKGYNQQYGIDYDEVFSPVAKLVTVRLLIAVATTHDWLIHQVDVNNAFLHGFLHDDIYMLPPQGYSKAGAGQVCKLVKSLYGLKQASREWNAEFCSHLFHIGFTQSPHDNCLFIRGTGSTFICLLVYVDDILITGPNPELISDLKLSLHQSFTIKDLGLARYFLGMEIVRGVAGTSLNQRKYILDLLSSMGLTGCTCTSTPLPPGVVLTTEASSPLTDPEKYRRLVGRLLYLNLTRPDISHAVQQLSQFMVQPCESHWDAAIHVLRYLKGSPSLGLFFPAAGSFVIRAYSDADWATCSDSRRSLTGFCIFLGECLISWRCKKQVTVSVSSAEAEYRALSATTRELLWISYLCADLEVPKSSPIPLFCDNRAAIHITRNPVFHERTKHLDLDCHFVRDKYKDGFISPVSISSSLQVADFFTKWLPGPRFRFLLSKLGLVDLHRLSLPGGVDNTKCRSEEVPK